MGEFNAQIDGFDNNTLTNNNRRNDYDLFKFKSINHKW